jgi:acetyltransferase-like isoleucine patch superfamily enzyme
MFTNRYYETNDLRRFGNFASVGENVRIAENCIILGQQNIHIGNNVRIDPFTTITAIGGYVRIGSNIHIGSYCFLAGGCGIVMVDFSGLSQGVKIYSKSDDYSGKYLTNPTVPSEYTNATGEEVWLQKHVIIGSASVILPGVILPEGCAIGALSLVTRSSKFEPFNIYAGNPLTLIKERSRLLLQLEEQYKNV